VGLINNNTSKPAYESLIFLSELGALIHDIGKLHQNFINQNSIELSKDYKNYLHGDILENDIENNTLKTKAADLKNILNGIELFYEDEDGNQIAKTSLYSFIKEHHLDREDSDPVNDIVNLLIASDRWDSDEDKGEAFTQQSICNTFMSNVFGFEKLIQVDYEQERERIYDILIKLLKGHDEKSIIETLKESRFDLFKNLKNSFDKTLGMTARAANDVSLWEHSYMTATILRALIAESIIRNMNRGLDQQYPFIIDKNNKDRKGQIKKKKPFTILSIGWNFFGFLSESEQISDVIGKIEVLNIIKEQIKQKIELNYLLGNHIFEDNEGLYFLIPASFILNQNKDLIEQIHTVFNEYTNGHLIPQIYRSVKGSRLSKLLPNAITNLKNQVIKSSLQNFNVFFKPKWIEEWKNKSSKNGLVCILCGKDMGKNNKERYCKACEQFKKMGRKQKSVLPQTIYLDEIAWNNEIKNYGKIALFILRFDLTNWFNGKYIKSNFISKYDDKKIMMLKSYYQSELFNDGKFNKIYIKDLLSLGALVQWIHGKNENVWESAKKEVNKCIDKLENLSKFAKNELANIKDSLERVKIELDDKNQCLVEEIFKKNLNFNVINEELKNKLKNIESEYLGDYRIEQKRKKVINGDKDEILNIFLKNSSPSRLMRVWNDTLKFFSELEKNICTSSSIIERFEFNLKNKSKKYLDNLAYECNLQYGVNSQKGEIIFQNDKLITITPHLNKSIKKRFPCDFNIKNNEVQIDKSIYNKLNIKAYRIISKTANQFIFLVSAHNSFEILNKIISKSQEKLGKAFGKLPLNIGIIYFKRKSPLSFVLDSARRFLDNFDSEHIKINSKKSIPMFEIKRTYENKIKAKRNKNEYKLKIAHMLGNGETDFYHPYLMVKNPDDNTIDVREKINEKHILDLKEGDQVLFHPSFFDFQFLDSNTRRFDIFYDDDNNDKKKLKDWNKRKSDPFGEFKSRPYILEDIERFNKIKEILKTLGSWSLIRDIEELLIAKKKEWSNNENYLIKGDKTFEIFIETVLENKIRSKTKAKFKKWDKTKIFLKNSILEGIFFDAIELFHTIMSINLEE